MTITSFSSQTFPMTVVMATLGGETLKGTIEQLNRGSVVPAEILVCIPEEDVFRAKNLLFHNVRVIETNCRGQVAQRAIGFQNATHGLVLQMDDDILVDKYCIEHLVSTILSQGKMVAVAPSMMNLSNGKSVYCKQQRNWLIEKIYFWLVNGSAGYQPGKIEKGGDSVGIDTLTTNEKICEVEWLPGGCVLHYRENLILENFYPFKGKAFCEDIFHSVFLKKRGISLFVDPGALCWIQIVQSSDIEILEFLRIIRADFRARVYLLKLCSRMSIRIYFYYSIRCLSYFTKKIIGYGANKFK